MDWAQTFFLVVGFPALAIGVHEVTHIGVARIACPVSIEHASWVPFHFRLNFDQMPSKDTLRIIALAPLLVGSVAAVIAVQTRVWQQITTADPYYLHHLAVAYWLLYIAPSPADLRLALWPPTENILDAEIDTQ